VVVDETDRVLLVRHTYGPSTGRPGGMSEPGEPFEATAMRELWEETGLRARIERLTGVYYKRENDSHHLVFRCRCEDGVPARARTRSPTAHSSRERSFRARSATSPCDESTMRLRRRHPIRW